MLKKLRMKFIVTAALSVAIVLFSIIVTINIRSYLDICRSADEKLTLLAENGGKFPWRDDRPSGNNSGKPMMGGMSPETPFETRFFTVKLSPDGSFISADTERIAAVDAEQAEKYAVSLFAAGKTNGFKGNFKFTTYESGDGISYIFLDCSRDLDVFSDFLRSSIFVSIGGFAVALALIIFFSGLVIRPVERTYKKQKRFITDASHELKTPLTVIDASCEALEISTGGNEWTDVIKKQTARLAEMTNKLVFLSRAEEETATVMTDFCLSEAAEDAVRPYFAIAKSQGRELSSEIAQNITLKGDISMIKELITLLLDNAVKYSADGSEICFALSQSGKSKKITVSNAVDTLPQGDLSLLFERFYRPDGSRNSEVGGHGIGLSVAKAITEMHHGKISVSPAEGGRKIVFTVTL